MEKIFIKFYFDDWNETTPEHAKKFITHIKNGITTRMTEEQKNEFINKRFLKGVTVEELQNKLNGAYYGNNY